MREGGLSGIGWKRRGMEGWREREFRHIYKKTVTHRDKKDELHQ